MNYITEYSLNELDENNYKVEKKKIVWDDVKSNLETWHDEIADIILNKEALYFFSTNNNDSIFLNQELTLEQKNMIKGILESLIKNPDNYFEEFEKRNTLYNLAQEIKDIEEIKNFCKKYGIDFKTRKQEFIKEKNRLLKKLNADYGFGLFGEILFYIVMEYLMSNSHLLLSKISFITAPGTFAHGSDGVFCEYDKKILFFGEAKFTLDLNSGIEQAISSLKDYNIRLNNDITFIVNHNRNLKNGYENYLDIINRDELEKFEKHIVVFVLHGEEYKDDEIKKILINSRSRIKKDIDEQVKIKIISFPILKKNKLKERIAYKVEKYDKKYR